ncbi:uncharacterized protein EI97DRAFT_155535 [Westerdykella ornata]|uniref:Uncharacterized protein n=1 Tax=Westerdykella ornata TaxID=318751 RepID=A0A6A6JAZ4_WESOR|nr:uncharacterized protein EI97DRAFT_155535 [Westerdykella ornata]KAF2273374.1 hypothetical protein EI97DRAFT_155535 [Westerdykella ornata]
MSISSLFFSLSLSLHTFCRRPLGLWDIRIFPPWIIGLGVLDRGPHYWVLALVYIWLFVLLLGIAALGSFVAMGVCGPLCYGDGPLDRAMQVPFLFYQICDRRMQCDAGPVQR